MARQQAYCLMIWAALSVFASNVGAAEDPRMEIPDVRRCIDLTKGFLSSSEYSTAAQEEAIIGACRDADPKCVEAAGDSLESLVRSKAQNFLPVVRACRGRGMGACLAAMLDRVSSFDRREPPQILALIKKCE